LVELVAAARTRAVLDSQRPAAIGAVGEEWRRAMTTDLLAGLLEAARRQIADSSQPTKARVRLLWSLAAAAHANNTAASDVIRHDFMALATDVGLISASGRWLPADVRDHIRCHGRTDINHVIDWAMRGRNPFEKKP
jgi:hypothetical protein